MAGLFLKTGNVPLLIFVELRVLERHRMGADS